VVQLPLQVNKWYKDIVSRLCSGWFEYKQDVFLECKAEYEPSFTQQNAVDLISEGTIIKFHDNSGGGGEH
jgi:hypothetical protein